MGIFWEQDGTGCVLEQGLHITARVNTSRRASAAGRWRTCCRRIVQPEEPSLEDAYLYLIAGGGGTMRTMRLFWLELGRLLQSRLTWLIVLLTVLSPLVGLTLYRPATASTMLTQLSGQSRHRGRRGGRRSVWHPHHL